MKIFKKSCFLFVLIFLSNLAIIFASDPMCCYDGKIDNQVKSFCDLDSDEIEIPLNGANLCDYNSKRKFCLRDGVECFGTINSFSFYDVLEVKDFLSSKGIDFDAVCDELISYSQVLSLGLNCNQNYFSNQNVNSEQNQGSSNQVNQGENSNSVEYNNEQSQIEESFDIESCSKLNSGPYDVFFNEDKCNSFVDIKGNKPCFYNPYYLSYLRYFNFKSESDILGLSQNEVGCQAKVEIKSCYDYKTKFNCEENVAFDYSKNRNLKDCKWISNQEYFDFNSFDPKSGFCIASPIENVKKHVKILEFSKNKNNLIENPSFENLSTWNFDSSLNKVFLENNFCYNLENCLKVLESGVFSQEISNFADENFYQLSFYVKRLSSVLDDDFSSKLKMEIEFDNGEIVEKQIDVDFEKNVVGSYFKFVQFDQVKVPKSVSKFVLRISSLNSDVLVDAVSFLKVSSSSLDLKANLFMPINLVWSKSSICQKCFDKYNLNFCTFNKSSFLGDCSYMVENYTQGYFSNINNYTGKFSNPYLNNWSSQSIANSLVFCEMYLDKDVCLDENNFVNSNFKKFHSLSSSTLCKWNDDFGCFKDSDNSNGPDVVSGFENILDRVYLFYDLNDLSKIGWDESNFANYVVDKNKYDFVDVNDFNYSCDSLPAQTYIYFKGEEVQSDGSVLTKVYETFPQDPLKVGNLRIFLETFDNQLEACERFNINKSLFVSYVVNSKNVSTQIYRNKNYLNFKGILVKDFFNIGGKNILEDGLNNIKIYVKDQSGNLGEVFEYDVNVDVNAPEIKVSNYDSNFVFGKGSKLNLSVKDDSGILSCRYELEVPQIEVNLGIDESFYEKEQNFNILDKPVLFEENFKIPINKTTSNVNIYNLKIVCLDIFNQESVWENFVQVDFNTDLLLLDPISFKNSSFDFGYLNKSQVFNFVSTDIGLESCDFKLFDQADQSEEFSGSFEIVSSSLGFDVENYNNLFYKNISGFVNFSKSGFKRLNVFCQDRVSNTLEKDYYFYFDDKAPVGINFSFVKKDFDNFLNVDGKYYVIKNSNSYKLLNKLNFSLDGTDLWISNKAEDFSLFLFDKDDNLSFLSSDFEFEGYRNDSFSSLVFMSNFDDLNNYRFLGDNVSTNHKDLFKQKFRLVFLDKAKNKGFYDFEYFFDNSKPKIEFNNFVFLENRGEVFTNQLNPNFNITFNAPLYREFKCSLNFNWLGNDYFKNFDFSNSLNFNLKDVALDFSLDLDSEVKDINILCVDKFNVSISENFDLIFDNLSPVLKDSYLSFGEDIYVKNLGEFGNYEVLSDNLNFELEDTNEKGVICEYFFENLDDNFVCDEQVFKVEEFNSVLFFSTSQFNILKFNLNQDAICKKTSNLDSILNKNYLAGEDFVSKLKLSVRCSDLSDLKSNVLEKEINLKFVGNDDFADFKVFYFDDRIVFKVYSISNYLSDLRVFYDLNSDVNSDEIVRLSLQDQKQKGLYVYEGEVLKENFEEFESEQLVWAIGFWKDKAVSKISTNFLVDKTAPSINFKINDANKNLEVFTSNFLLEFEAEDFGTGLNYVKLFLEDKQIFDSNNLSNFDANYIFKPKQIDNEFFNEGESFLGKVVFNNLSKNQVYNFRILAVDNFGNFNSLNFSVKVVDDFVMILKDSFNSVSDFYKTGWITKDEKPVVSFKLSKPASWCRVYPFFDSQFKDLIDDENILFYNKQIDFLSLDDLKIFSFNLNEFDNFNLSYFDNKIDLRFVCFYNQSFYNFTKSLELIDILPDYVVSSKDGFVLNDAPYESLINVKSVGYQRPIRCNYSFDDSLDYKSFGKNFKENLSLRISFDDLVFGVHKLNVVCFDKLGNVGAFKSYDFLIDKLDNIKILNVSLYSKEDVFYFADDFNRIFVNQDSNLSLVFKTNRISSDCSYLIEYNNGGFFGSILSFFKNLFYENSNLVSNNVLPYVLASDFNINLPTKNSKLTINCENRNLDNQKYNLKKEFEIIYLNDSYLDFDLEVVN